MYDYKGLLTSPPVKGDWVAYCLPLDSAEVQSLPFSVNSVVHDLQSCSDIHGSHLESHWGERFDVSQTGCNVQFMYKGGLKTGFISGSSLQVQGWASASALPDGTIQFSDGGFWTKSSGQPVFKRGYLHVSGTPKDTFLDTDGLTKGLIWVNGYNIGRFWATQGPQYTLYVPAPFLNSGENEVIVLDLEGAASTSIFSVAAHRYPSSAGKHGEFLV
jgi:hypothetical protein